MRAIITLESGKKYVLTSLGIIDSTGRMSAVVHTKITVKRGCPLVFGDAEGTVQNLGTVVAVKCY